MSRANEPVHPTVRNPEHGWPTGITLREYFAAMTIQGLLANRGITDALTFNKIGVDDSARRFAQAAVVSSDALIAELAK